MIAMISRALKESKLTMAEQTVLVVLANHANVRDGGLCWPSMATLVKGCRCSESTVHRTLGSLCDRGLIAVDRRGGGRDGDRRGVRYLVYPTAETLSEHGFPEAAEGVTMTPTEGVTMTPKIAVDSVTMTPPRVSPGHPLRARDWQEQEPEQREAGVRDRQKNEPDSWPISASQSLHPTGDLTIAKTPAVVTAPVAVPFAATGLRRPKLGNWSTLEQEAS